MANLDSGLSMLDWMAIDKDAARDLVDGLRDLKKQRPKRGAKYLEASGVAQPNRINAVEPFSDDNDGVMNQSSL
ncbi:hypothetical protein [Parasitella parasitica]|uniref:Uncharacterized protein n=1 Tax=Parasitella parasitica TaxID=35722 RepID=A0A0B7NF33_9FUNG|nr:hypothetical protein [Parasitella parasitica]